MIDEWDEIKAMVEDCWEKLSAEVMSLREAFAIVDEEERPYVHNYNWQVPKNICRRHQVTNRKPSFIHARSRL